MHAKHFYVMYPTTSVARILQWGVEKDTSFDHTLYTEADPESFGGVDGRCNFEPF